MTQSGHLVSPSAAISAAVMPHSALPQGPITRTIPISEKRSTGSQVQERKGINMTSRKVWVGFVMALAVWAAAIPASAQNIRGSTTGPTTARGYDHPDQFIHLRD